MYRKHLTAEGLRRLDPAEGGADGLRVITPTIRPRRGTAGRRPFPLLDLRTREEHVAAKFDSFETISRKLVADYATDPPLGEDPAMVLRDAVIWKRAVWSGLLPVHGTFFKTDTDTALRAQRKVERARRKPQTPRIKGRSAFILGPGAKNYFHWMSEFLPRLARLRDFEAREGRVDQIVWLAEDPADYVLDGIRALFPDYLDRVLLLEQKAARFEELVFFADPRVRTNLRMRLKDTSGLLLDRLGDEAATTGPPTQPLFLSRADAKRRHLLNEAAVLDALAPLGVQPVTMTGRSVAEQRALMQNAPLLVGPHGAGLANAMFLPPGATLVELTTTQYLGRCRSFADLVLYRGLNYGLVVLDQHGDKLSIEGNVGNDMVIAPAMLPRLVEFIAELRASPGGSPPIPA